MADNLFFVDRHGEEYDNDRQLITTLKSKSTDQTKPSGKHSKQTGQRQQLLSTASTHDGDTEGRQQAADVSKSDDESDGDVEDIHRSVQGFDDNQSSHTLKQSKSKRSKREVQSRSFVWYDEDDVEQNVNLLQVPRRKKLRNDPSEHNIKSYEYQLRLRELNEGNRVKHGPGMWAKIPDDLKSASDGNSNSKADLTDEEDKRLSDNSDGDDMNANLSAHVHSLLRSSEATVNASRRARIGTTPSKGGVLDLRVVSKVNSEEPSNAEPRCVDFHPTGRMLMTAGLDKTVRLFHVDGEKNAKLQSMHIKNFPIHSACFAGGGEQIILAGRRRYFHVFDLQSEAVSRVNSLSHFEEKSWERMVGAPDGNRFAFVGVHGRIVFVSNRSRRPIGQIRLNSRVADIRFAPQGSGASEHEFYACSTDGTIYLWDTRRMTCVDKHRDEGAVHSTCLTVSPSHYGCGSDSGVVNLYMKGTLSERTSFHYTSVRTETPVKSFLNIRTPIHHIAFNPDGKLMAFASHDKKASVRIAHTESLSVFSNWPTTRTNLHHVCSLTFSPGGGFLAVGDSRGDIHLLRLMAYPAC